MEERKRATVAVLSLLACLALVLAGPGCAKKGQTVSEPVEVEVVDEQVYTGENVGEAGVDEQNLSAAAAAGQGLTDVHFDFDRYNLTPEAREILRVDYGILKKMSDPEILVEGHCDNRGTVEYNLALGQRRAESVRSYLIGLGMPASRVSTISYGEEKPLDPSDSEEAWALNRRAHIVVLTR